MSPSSSCSRRAGSRLQLRQGLTLGDPQLRRRSSTVSGRSTGQAARQRMFSTVSGKLLSLNNVLRRWVWPACQAADLERATWLTFRRTYSSWAHHQGVPATAIVQITALALRGRALIIRATTLTTADVAANIVTFLDQFRVESITCAPSALASSVTTSIAWSSRRRDDRRTCRSYFCGVHYAT